MSNISIRLMKLQKKNFYIDTSVLSLISFTKAGEQSSQVIKNYECFLDQMDLPHPTFVDADFTWIVTSALLLELIGLGQVKTEAQKSSKYERVGAVYNIRA